MSFWRREKNGGYRPTEVRAADLAENVMVALEIDNKSVILTHWRGEVVAFSGRCPHAAADLSRGELYKGRVDCPVHGWRFDIVSGRTLFPPDESCRLRRFPVKVDEKSGRVWVNTH